MLIFILNYFSLLGVLRSRRQRRLSNRRLYLNKEGTIPCTSLDGLLNVANLWSHSRLVHFQNYCFNIFNQIFYLRKALYLWSKYDRLIDFFLNY